VYDFDTLSVQFQNKGVLQGQLFILIRSLEVNDKDFPDGNARMSNKTILRLMIAAMLMEFPVFLLQNSRPQSFYLFFQTPVVPRGPDLLP
jgi:hypothetical protein